MVFFKVARLTLARKRTFRRTNEDSKWTTKNERNRSQWHDREFVRNPARLGSHREVDTALEIGISRARSRIWHRKSSHLLARRGHRPLRAALDAIPGPTSFLARLPNVPIDRASVTANQISILGSHRILWAASIAPARRAPPPPPHPGRPPAPGPPAPAPSAGCGRPPPATPLVVTEGAATFSHGRGGALAAVGDQPVDPWQGGRDSHFSVLHTAYGRLQADHSFSDSEGFL